MNANLVILAGRLTRGPELRHTDGGTAVTEVTLASNRVFVTSKGERRKEEVFADLVFWARKAEAICKYAQQGTEIYLQGRLETDRWVSPTGEKRSRLRVVVDHFQFVKGTIGSPSEKEDEEQDDG